MNKQEITSVLSELYKITGFRMSLHSTNFEEIAAFPKEGSPFCTAVNKIDLEHSRCMECDKIACTKALNSKGTHSYKCRYGLSGAVSPLYHLGTLTGFLMMGQVADSREAAERAAELLSEKTAGRANVPSNLIKVVDPDTASSYIKIMTICAHYLTMSNAMNSAKPTVAELAKEYISDNLDKRILISDICDALKCSKSTLLTTFKKQYGVTVNSYITETKLDLAKGLLYEGKMTISEIAEATGFSDQSYFSKVFSAKHGIPPSEYRSSIKNTDN